MRFLKFKLVVLGLLALVATATAEEKSRVYYAIDSGVLGPAQKVRVGVVQRMMDSLICNLTGKNTPAEAWRTLVSPQDTVGIKVAASGQGVSGTHPEVVQAIVTGLLEAGVKAENIIVWDRNVEDLQAAGFDAKDGRYTLLGIDPATGYDSEAQVSAPVLGKLIWGDRKFGSTDGLRFADLLDDREQLSSQSYFASILSQKVNKVINLPSLQDHFLTGINGAMVNMTLSNLDNWRRFAKSAAGGDYYLAEVYADPAIAGKVVLTILDALILQYAGGPFPNPNYAVENLSLFASTDPVAIDATALRLIDEVRKANKLPSIERMTRYLESGPILGLGEYSESRIDMIRVGVEGLR